MPIGDFYATISEKLLGKFVYRLFGTMDLHTHIRLRAMISFLKDYFNQCSIENVEILELGCGNGINAFEIHKITSKEKINFNYIGVDLASKAIETANEFLRAMPDMRGEVSFYQEEAISFLEKEPSLKFDVILLIDIIEHVKDSKKLLSLCKKHLKRGGLFIISVPTPLYPKFFGRKFHAQVGHIVDGYSLSQIDEYLQSFNCQRMIYKYNTGLFSNLGCWLYYNKLNFSNNRYFRFLKAVLLYPFKFLDFINNQRLSCSLFVVYKNEK